MLISNTMVIYHGILTLEKGGTMVNYGSIFITLDPGSRRAREELLTVLECPQNAE
jgi:hypothetical protein